MPHVQLFGKGNPRAVEIPAASEPTSESQPDEGRRRHQEAVFACLRDLEVHFETAGISDRDYWEVVKRDFSIVSRSELSASEYARISATLNACRRDPSMFNRLVAKVKAHKVESVPVEDASDIIFADPEDTIDASCFVIRRNKNGTEKLIFVGVFSADIVSRCQAHADETRCIVFLFHDGEKQPFFPLREGCSSPV